MALSRVVSEIFNVEKYRDLEIPVKGHSWSLKIANFSHLRVFCAPAERVPSELGIGAGVRKLE